MDYAEELVGVQVRACALCTHGSSGKCVSSDVMWGNWPVAFVDARSSHGSCGPEARYLDFPGLDSPHDPRLRSGTP